MSLKKRFEQPRDLRSIGKVPQVVKQMLKDPRLIKQCISLLDQTEDRIIAMRCADALEKVSRINYKLLQSHKNKLINVLIRIERDFPEAKWNLLQTIVNLKLNKRDQNEVYIIIKHDVLESDNAFLLSLGIKSLGKLYDIDPRFRNRASSEAKRFLKHKSKAVSKQAEKLLEKISK